MPKAAVITDEEVAARLRLSATRLHRRLRRHAGDALTPSQTSALAAIDVHGPLTLGALAEHEGVSAPSVTKVLAILEDDGLVQRAPDPADRRVNYVSVTPKGAALVEESRRRKTAWLTERVRELDADQRRALAEALDVLDALSQNELAQKEAN